MALQIQNIAAPQWDNAGAVRGAFETLNRSLESAKQGLSTFDAARKSAADAALAERLAMFNSPDEIKAAMQSGALTAGLPHVSAAGMKSINDRASALTDLGLKSLQQESLGLQMKNQALDIKRKETESAFIRDNASVFNEYYGALMSGDTSKAQNILSTKLQGASPEVLQELVTTGSRYLSDTQNRQMKQYEFGQTQLNEQRRRILSEIEANAMGQASQEDAIAYLSETLPKIQDPIVRNAAIRQAETMFPGNFGPTQTDFGLDPENIAIFGTKEELATAEPVDIQFAENLKNTNDPVQFALYKDVTSQGLKEHIALIKGSGGMPYDTVFDSMSDKATPQEVVIELEKQGYGHNSWWPANDTDRSNLLGLINEMADTHKLSRPTIGKILAYSIDESDWTDINWGKGITVNKNKFSQLINDIKTGKLSVQESVINNLKQLDDQLDTAKKKYEEVIAARKKLEKSTDTAKKEANMPKIAAQEKLAADQYRRLLWKANKKNNQPSYSDNIGGGKAVPIPTMDGRPMVRGNLTNFPHQEIKLEDLFKSNQSEKNFRYMNFGR